jgi:hypothetical protein
VKEKRFTIVLPDVAGVSESRIKRALLAMLIEPCGNKEEATAMFESRIQAFEHNKTHTCDGCGKERRDVKACGRDSNGDADSPDLCFLCRKMGERGKVWSSKEKRYVPQVSIYADEELAVDNVPD